MTDTSRRNQLRAEALEERRMQAALASGGTRYRRTSIWQF